MLFDPRSAAFVAGGFELVWLEIALRSAAASSRARVALALLARVALAHSSAIVVSLLLPLRASLVRIACTIGDFSEWGREGGKNSRALLSRARRFAHSAARSSHGVRRATSSLAFGSSRQIAANCRGDRRTPAGEDQAAEHVPLGRSAA